MIRLRTSEESLIQGFYIALGQYLSYLKMLIGTKSDRILYLAVPEDKHKKMQKSDFYKEMLEDYKMKLVIYHPIMEIIEQWIN
ncbi:MAG: hypothetical protein H7A25_24610 [Leptospiraceae bacterium]|nr:hypothetical protein [Leptospiraceae bacterium]